jgi:putative endonuclease
LPAIGYRNNGMAKTPCVYVLASTRNGTLYVGVTSDLFNRAAVHRQDLIEGFTKRYGVHRLVYYEMHNTMPEAIRHEKQLKKWNRSWKIRLIEQMTRNGWTSLTRCTVRSKMVRPIH